MINAHWYVRNDYLHKDLQVDVVTSEIRRFAQKHEGRLHHHENVPGQHVHSAQTPEEKPF
jgi:hypothetical protein